MQENWDRISHLLTNQYRGHGYKLSLFKNITYLRTEITERSETRIILGVPSDLERQLIQRTISPNIINEILKIIPSQFSVDFEVTGRQITFPAPVLNPVLEARHELTPLPTSTELIKKTIELTDYSFAETLIGEENSILIKAFKRTIESPTHTPFPLLITGTSGTGKSHHAKMAWTELKNAYPDSDVKLISGERFLTDFLEHIKSKQTWKFQKKYRTETDILIIDDISCLKGAKKTQEEFLAVLDHFQSRQKIIIVTLPCLPSELIGLDPAIASRLTAGLHIPIERPSLEFRRSFIEHHLFKLNLKIESDCLDLLKESTSCFREIKGILNKINFLFAGRTDLISTTEVHHYIKFAEVRTKPQTPEQILKLTSERFKISVDKIISKSRAKPVVTARNYAICMMREKLGISLQEIGRNVGYRDHSTIRHSLKIGAAD